MGQQQGNAPWHLQIILNHSILLSFEMQKARFLGDVHHIPQKRAFVILRRPELYTADALLAALKARWARKKPSSVRQDA